MKLFISAGEVSSDIHSSHLLKSLTDQVQNKDDLVPLTTIGMGGPQLRKVGMQTVIDSRKLSVMGFSEVLGFLPRIFRALKTLENLAAKEKPDLAILVDFPDFNFLLARRLKKLGIPMIYYIPPKVWVWRKHRIRFMQRFFDKILCILPFEKKYYEQAQLPSAYVGNPLLDELPLSLTKNKAREKLEIQGQGFLGEVPLYVTLMPGSRQFELDHHLVPMLEATVLVARKLQQEGRIKSPIEVLIPLSDKAHWENGVKKVTLGFQECKEIRIHPRFHESAVCLAASDAGLIKSGTSTLEAALLRCPHAVVYRPSRSTSWIFKNLIHYQGPVGLSNLSLERFFPKFQDSVSSLEDPIFPEVLNERVNETVLSEILYDILTSKQMQDRMSQGFEEIQSQYQASSESPSWQAAKEVLEFVSSRSAP